MKFFVELPKVQAVAIEDLDMTILIDQMTIMILTVAATSRVVVVLNQAIHVTETAQETAKVDQVRAQVIAYRQDQMMETETRTVTGQDLVTEVFQCILTIFSSSKRV